MDVSTFFKKFNNVLEFGASPHPQSEETIESLRKKKHKKNENLTLFCTYCLLSGQAETERVYFQIRKYLMGEINSMN